MTFFLQSANVFKPTNESALNLHEKLPAGNYTIKQDPFKNFFLEAIDPFVINTKLYGNVARYTTRILNTFNSRDVSTGILLSGEKGSGKSLLAKNISDTAAKNDIPTIIINEPWCGDDFNQLIQSITQPAIILFDEFEKVYDRDDQKQLLTLLDGTYATKKLFIFTCNEKYRIDDHMKNRPGRIFYMLEFNGLEPDFIIEYCNDNLINKQYINDISKLAVLFDEFNFDMLKALCEEMNRYGESPHEVLEMLNAKPELQNDCDYHVQLVINGNTINDTSPETIDTNPLAMRTYIDYKIDDQWYESSFQPSELSQLIPEENKFIFTNKDNNTLILTRRAKVSRLNYRLAF